MSRRFPEINLKVSLQRFTIRCRSTKHSCLHRAIHEKIFSKTPQALHQDHDDSPSMRTLLLGLLVLSGVAFAEIPLEIGPGAKLEASRLPNGVVDFTVTGPNAHFWTSVVPDTFDPEKHTVLTFDYFSLSGVSRFSVRYRQDDESMVLVASDSIPLAQAWQPMSFDLSASETELTAPGEKSRFHFALKYEPDTGLQIRNIRLREPTEQELLAILDRRRNDAERAADAEAILAYFREDYPGRISEVLVGRETVVVRGSHEGPVRLRELRVQHPSHMTGLTEDVIGKEVSGDFEVEIPRFAAPDHRDRAFSRFRLDTPEGEPASLAHWGTIGPELAKKMPELKADHQKGLGAIPVIGSEDHEIFQLGIEHATVNLVVNELVSDKPRPGDEKIRVEGRDYYLNRRLLREREVTVENLSRQGVIVTAILLVGNSGASTLVHPEAEPRGIFAMPNLVTQQGADFYKAALQVIANRFTHPDKRIANWVIHNEIDQARTWTNMGDQPLARYMETYHRSARLVYQTMRLRDPHARVFISLTHHWAKRSLGKGAYTVNEMVPIFNEMGLAEGNYEWGVAYHLFPQHLRDPRSWNDSDVRTDFETPYITPKNFEVLPAYLAQEQYLYKGEPRGILFSEQGWNTPTLGLKDQVMQLAGLVDFFRRLASHPVIEAFHLHRYQDMPDREGGLRFGIIDEHGNRKLAWHAYRAIGTKDVTPFEIVADHVIRATSDD